jgi:uncharacterized protein YjbI with pentapeptide repeats
MLRRLWFKINWWLGLAGNINLVFTVLAGGALATVLTTAVVYAVSFLDFVSGIPLFFRVAFYASVFFLSFALFSHGRQHLADWWIRLNGAPNVSPEVAAQERWRGQDALDAYLDQMQQWLLDEQRPLASLPYNDPQRKMARTRTLAILRRLDANGKREILRFLKEQELISKESPAIRLGGADFSGANLTRMEVWDANLDRTNLSGADLTHVSMSGGGGHSASMGEAVKRGSEHVFEDSIIPDRSTSFTFANFSGAVLRRARLGGCNLLGVDFDGADFTEADLRGADLRLAKNLTQEQIESAFGYTGGQEYMPDTLLPDYLTPSEAWKRLISLQIKERGY